MVTFSETRGPTSREYVGSQGVMMPNLLQTVQCFWSHSSVFALENYSKYLNFWNIFASKRAFGGNFLWNIRTHITELRIAMPNTLQTLQVFWLHSSLFALEK